ncbi:MAG: T9SS type A sorting domain-containing protein [Aquaticitalea sp.]
MKKITCILIAIIAGSMVFQAGAQTATSSEAQNLLDRLGNLPPTAVSVREAITQNFNESEQTILLNYFANEVANRPSFPSRSLPGVVYAFDIQSFDLGTFPLAGPYSIDVLSSPENLFLADDFDAEGNWYAIGGFNGVLQLLSVSTVDGSFTGIAPLTIPPGLPSGLSYNPVNETWYMIHNNGNTNRSELYSVNISTGAVTLINADTGMSQGIWLEIDNNGIAYSIDITNDNLYTIDLQTGVATLVGPFGFNLQFTQEAFIDHETNILYAAAYISSNSSAIYSIDVTTGAGTSLFDTTPAELTMASMNNLTLGVPENVLTSISIFPNPATNVINIELPSNVEISEATIYSLTGQKLLEFSNTNKIDISNLSSGMYLLRMKDTENNSITKQIIKN